MRTAKTLIRLGRCPGWSESSMGAQIILLVLSWHGLYGTRKSFRQRAILWSYYWKAAHLCLKELEPHNSKVSHETTQLSFLPYPCTKNERQRQHNLLTNVRAILCVMTRKKSGLQYSYQTLSYFWSYNYREVFVERFIPIGSVSWPFRKLLLPYMAESSVGYWKWWL